VDAEKEQATIMIVDDTPENLELLAEMLHAQGYRVMQFPSGALALRAAKKNPPDLILLDIMMPDMDGYQVCRALKADKALKKIPVIFISALGEVNDKVKGLSAGGVDLLWAFAEASRCWERVLQTLTGLRVSRAGAVHWDCCRWPLNWNGRNIFQILSVVLLRVVRGLRVMKFTWAVLPFRAHVRRSSMLPGEMVSGLRILME